MAVRENFGKMTREELFVDTGAWFAYILHQFRYHAETKDERCGDSRSPFLSRRVSGRP